LSVKGDLNHLISLQAKEIGLSIYTHTKAMLVLKLVYEAQLTAIGFQDCSVHISNLIL